MNENELWFKGFHRKQSQKMLARMRNKRVFDFPWLNWLKAGLVLDKSTCGINFKGSPGSSVGRMESQKNCDDSQDEEFILGSIVRAIETRMTLVVDRTFIPNLNMD